MATVIFFNYLAVRLSVRLHQEGKPNLAAGNPNLFTSVNSFDSDCSASCELSQLDLDNLEANHLPEGFGSCHHDMLALLFTELC